MAIGYKRPLYLLPFDHRGSFETKMFGWHGALDTTQTAEIARRYLEFVAILERARAAPS
jgi:hypothetical protein